MTAEFDALRHADTLIDLYPTMPNYQTNKHLVRLIVSLIEYGLGLSTAEATAVFRIMRDENMSVARAYRYHGQVKA